MLFLGVRSQLFDDTLIDNHAQSGSVERTLLADASFIDTAQASRNSRYNDLPVGFTEEGYPYIGNPSAQVTLIEFSDYLCPFCGRHFTQTVPTLLKEYGETGLVRFVFREFPIAQLHPTAHYGSAAALCAGQQEPELFWAMHDELFSRQGEWNQLPDPASFLVGVAEELDLELDLYTECINSEQIQDSIDQGIADAQELGLTGTPSFQFLSTSTDKEYTLIGSQSVDVFRQWLDALLAGEEPPVEPEPEKPELPYWANSEGLQPDPDNPGHTLAGDQYKGDANAPIVVVEFSDFQCPACARHSNKVQPLLDAAFVYSDTNIITDTSIISGTSVTGNTVRWVFKHFPLREHEFAPVSAAAAECAAEQNAFWAMHDLLFETVDEWAGTEPEASILDSFETVFTATDEESDKGSADEVDGSVEQQTDTALVEDELVPSKEIRDVEEALVGLAESLDLDTDDFYSCLTSRRALEKVLHDIYDAQDVVQQTPTFVILFEGQGSMLRGAREAEQFAKTLQSFVDR